MNTRTGPYARAILYAALIGFAMLFLMPAYMTVITAFKDPADIRLDTAWHVPRSLNWNSFAEAIEKLAPNAMNSLILAVIATGLSSILGSINGYVLSKWKFPGHEVVFTLMLFGMFIPYQIILIPLFQTLRSIHMYGGIPGLVLAHVVYGLPITTLIFRNFYTQIPTALTESAQIDGAGFFRMYSRVILPLSIPGFVVVFIWQFTQIWNEFLWGITLAKHSAQPITVGLAQLAGGQAVKWNIPMAGSILAALPVLLIYIVLGRYFIRGLLAGSVKG